MFDGVVALETQFAKEVETEEGEDDNPEGEVDFAVEETPAAVEVGLLEELESERQFEEGEDDLDGVEPGARFHVLEELGEHGEKGEGRGEADAEAQHGDEGDPAVGGAGGETHEGSAEDGTGATEGDQDGGQRDEEGGEETALVGLLVAGVDPLLGHLDFEEAEETEGEGEEDAEEEEVGNPVGTHDVERLRTEDECEDGAQDGEEEDDAEAEEPCLTATLALVFDAAHEEVDGHGNHGEDAGGEHGEDAAAKGEEEYHQEALVLFCVTLRLALRGHSILRIIAAFGDCHAVLLLFHSFSCRCFFCFDFGARHREGEVAVLRGDAAAVVAELVAEGALDGEVLVGEALHFLTEDDGAAERLDDAAKNLVHLLVGFGFQDFAHTLVVGRGCEFEVDGEGAVGVGMLRVEMPSGVELGGEHQFGLVGGGLLDGEGPLDGVELLGFEGCELGTENQAEEKQQ